MSKVTVEVNYAGVGELLRSAAVASVVKKQADRIAGRCGTGYKTDQKVLNTRVVASTYTGTDAAARDNSKNNTLLKAVSG